MNLGAKFRNNQSSLDAIYQVKKGKCVINRESKAKVNILIRRKNNPFKAEFYKYSSFDMRLPNTSIVRKLSIISLKPQFHGRKVLKKDKKYKIVICAEDTQIKKYIRSTLKQSIL